ncbi:formate dehydrogenase cytochrome b556 subunit, partial [Morganella morganii]
KHHPRWYEEVEAEEAAEETKQKK